MSQKRFVIIVCFLCSLLGFSVISLVFQINSFWPFSPYKMYSHIRDGVVLYEFRIVKETKPFELPLIQRRYFGPLDDYMKFSYIIYDQDKPFTPPDFSPTVYKSAIETFLSWNVNLKKLYPDAVGLRMYRIYYQLNSDHYRIPADKQLIYEVKL